MCHLVFYPANVEINETHLENASWFNRDGSGWAIVTRKGIITGRSMNHDDAVESFLKARKVHKGEALFHLRFATAGTTDVYNVHPFRVGRDKRTVMAHNGVLAREFQPRAKDGRSDTHLFADVVLPKLMELVDASAGLDAIGTLIGKGNKFVILTANPKYAKRAYIVNEASGDWDEDGSWHSNGDHKYEVLVPKGGKGARSLTTWGDEGWDGDVNNPNSVCWQCESVGSVAWDTALCTACHVCQDCAGIERGKMTRELERAQWTECDCFTSSSASRDANTAWAWDDHGSSVAGRSVESIAGHIVRQSSGGTEFVDGYGTPRLASWDKGLIDKAIVRLDDKGKA